MKIKSQTAVIAAALVLLAAGLGYVVLSGDGYEEGSISHLGTNVEGAKIGLAVPDYTWDKGIKSIGDLKGSGLFGEEIVGIDAGAGVVMAAESALGVYGLDGWSVKTSSSPAMISALASAVDAGEDIVVTMWNPHWAVGKYGLKYLEDPEEVFGGEEQISTIGNTAWIEVNPEAVAIAERFEWTMADIGSVMAEIEEGKTPAQAAQTWIDDNQATVAAWIDDVEGSGKIKIGLVNWECAVASSNVMKLVFEQAGFQVELVEADAGVMYTGLAGGDVHLSFTAWVPLTHASYYEKYVEDFEDYI